MRTSGSIARRLAVSVLPKIITAPLSIMSRAQATAFSGRFSSLQVGESIFRPAMPPAALTSSTHIFTALSRRVPTVAAGPVSGATCPDQPRLAGLRRRFAGQQHRGERRKRERLMKLLFLMISSRELRQYPRRAASTPGIGILLFRPSWFRVVDSGRRAYVRDRSRGAPRRAPPAHRGHRGCRSLP